MSSLGPHHPALDEFLQWEEQAWIECVADISADDTAFFMPLELLKSHFSANKSRGLCQILCELFNALHPPVDADLVLREHTAIFCILLRLGHGRMIEHFVRYEELSDRRLPFDLGHPPAEFPRLKEDSAFLQLFCEVQWMYCVPVFDGHMLHRHFGKQRLFPIVEKQEYGFEGMAARYLVRLYGPHNRLLPANQMTVSMDLKMIAEVLQLTGAGNIESGYRHFRTRVVSGGGRRRTIPGYGEWISKCEACGEH